MSVLQVDAEVDQLALIDRNCRGPGDGEYGGLAAPDATRQDGCRDDSQPQRCILRRTIHILPPVAERALNLRRWTDPRIS